MAAVLKHWREAATLIILAPATRLQPSTITGYQSQHGNNNKIKQVNGQNTQDYETLLLKRYSKSTFLPNLHAFPGGTSENYDFSSEWISVFGKLGKDFQQSVFEKVTRGSSKASPMFTRFREPQFSAIPPEVAFRVSAIRETFEESGILIVKKINEVEKDKNGMLSEQWNQSSSLSSADDDNKLNLKEWRIRVIEHPDNFLKMCKEMDLIPDITSLYEWTDWLTATAMPGRRYDTVFYIGCLENKPETKGDSNETAHYQWMSPSSILSSYYDGSVGLAPPQVYELSRMMQFNSAADLMKFSADRESERVERFFPVIAFTDDAVISLMPGDDLYPTHPDLYTPRTVIQFDQPIEEVNKGVKNFNRTVMKNREPGSRMTVEFNIVFKNKHIGPVANIQKVLENV